MPTMKRSIRAAALVALCATAVNRNANSANAFSHSHQNTGRGARPLHMVSTPIDIYSAPGTTNTIPRSNPAGNSHSDEDELLRQISQRMQRRQQLKRLKSSKNNKKMSKIVNDSDNNDSGNQSAVKIIRSMRSNPKAKTRRSGKGKSPIAEMTNYMPTDSLTSSSTRRGRLLTLSKEEEGDISDSIQDLREVMHIRSSMQVTNGKGIEIMPTEEEWADAADLSVDELRRVVSDGAEARTRLVAANTGLVTSIAKRHYASLKRNTNGGGGIGTILTLHDLVQEGNLGLMEAAERFDPSKGFRFSTYASYWIRQRISRSIADSSRVIRLPAHVHTMLGTIKKTQKEMAKELGRSPTQEDVADRLGIPEQKLKLYSDASRNVLSLEKPLNANLDDMRTLGDKIASRSPTPADDAEFDSLRSEIREAMEGLTERERDVIIARFGLDNVRPPLSVDETSRTLGISRDRCRTIQARALHKLRHPNRNYRLKEYVGEPDVQEEGDAFLLEQQQQLQLQKQLAQTRATPVEPIESPESMWSF